jgi:hypothetical protein
MLHTSPPAPHHRKWRCVIRSPWFDVLQFILLIVAILWFFARGTESLGYYWHWYQVPKYIFMIKDSALVSTIAIYDLTMQAQAIISETFLTFELWFTVAAMYLAVTVSLSMIVLIMEKRFKVIS